MERRIHLVHQAVEEMRCVFNAIVIKNSALIGKYPGGLRAFVEKHRYCRCNSTITTESAMGNEVQAIIYDLMQLAFKHKKDFLFVEVSDFAMFFGAGLRQKPGPHPVDLGVNWLQARYDDGGIYVRYVEKTKRDPAQGQQSRINGHENANPNEKENGL